MVWLVPVVNVSCCVEYNIYITFSVFFTVGNMLSGYPFSLIVKHYGWQSGYQIVETSVLLSVIASSFLLYRALVSSLHKQKKQI